MSTENKSGSGTMSAEEIRQIMVTAIRDWSFATEDGEPKEEMVRLFAEYGELEDESGWTVLNVLSDIIDQFNEIADLAGRCETNEGAVQVPLTIYPEGQPCISGPGDVYQLSYTLSDMAQAGEKFLKAVTVKRGEMNPPLREARAGM